MSRERIAAALALVGLGVLLAGCGSSNNADRISGRVLTIYTSLPLRGASRADAAAVLGGEELALSQIHGRIGHDRIVLRALDDSTPQRGQWDPGQTEVNARIAIQDRTTIGYIGELDSGASAVSIPLLNRTKIPQISPTSSAVGLTSPGAGAAPGEPEKYYPTGSRTFVRLVPSDAVQANVQVSLQQSLGCKRTYVVDDDEFDGETMADSFQLVARSRGLDVVAVQAFQPGASSYAPLAAGVAQSGANCVLITAIPGPATTLVTRQIAAALPTARLFATASVAASTFTDPARGGVPVSLDPRLLITSPTPDPSGGPVLAREFYAAYERRYGQPGTDAIYGYEAMSLMFSSIEHVTDDGTHPALRSGVLDELFDTHQRQSVLGTYGITPDGDTTLRRFGVYRIENGRPAFWIELDG